MPPTQDPAVASAVIQEAKNQGAYPGEIPTDPGTLLATANQLIEMAEAAVASNVAGPQVQAVLAASLGGAAPAAPGAVPPPNAFLPQAQQAPAPAAPSVAPTPPAPPAAPAAPEPPVIQDQAGNTYTLDDPVQAAQLDAYLAGGYTLISGGPSAPVAPAAPAQPEAPAGPAEPWQGYEGSKIPDIVSQIEAIVAQGNGDYTKQMLGQVWEYENSRKQPRKRLLSKLEEIAKGGTAASAAAPAPQAPGVPPAPTPAEGADVAPQPPFAGVPAPAAPAAPVPPSPQAPQAPGVPAAAPATGLSDDRLIAVLERIASALEER